MENLEHFTGKKILVAEDDMLNKMIMKKILEKIPVEFQIVENGKLALDAFLEQRFDLVFLDIQMPVMDGYEAAKAIRSTNVQIPIICLTASINTDLETAVKSAGMNDYLIKPFSPDALYQKILEYLK